MNGFHQQMLRFGQKEQKPALDVSEVWLSQGNNGYFVTLLIDQLCSAEWSKQTAVCNFCN